MGALVVMTFDVTNPANIPIRDVGVTDDGGLVITFTGGDTDGDDELDPSETWTYRADVGPAIPVRSTVGTVTGLDIPENHSPTTTQLHIRPTRADEHHVHHDLTANIHDDLTARADRATHWHAASHGNRPFGTTVAVRDDLHGSSPPRIVVVTCRQTCP